jgi:hypothetical protein
MKENEHEGRLEVRRNLIFYLTVRNRESGEVIGELGDITEKGALLISDHMLPVLDTVPIAVELPKGPDYPDTTLDLTVEIQWSKRDEDNPDLALSGCRIVGPNKNDKTIIRKLIEKIGFSNGQRRILFSESSPDFSEPR